VLTAFAMLCGNFTVLSQSDTILFNQLIVKIEAETLSIDDVFEFGEFTTLRSNYNPEKTLFYYMEKPFTGTAVEPNNNDYSSTIVSFSSGRLHGQWFNNYAGLKTVGEYLNGKKTGKWAHFDDNQLTSEENYEDGMVTGSSIVYIYTIDEKSSYFLLDNQPLKKDITRHTLHENGKPVSETYFLGDEPLSGKLAVFRYKELAEEHMYANGKIKSQTTFFNMGNGQKKEREITLLDSGNLRLLCYFDDEYNPIKDSKEAIFKPKGFLSSPWYINLESYDSEFERIK
jgi:hypothetical protein